MRLLTRITQTSLCFYIFPLSHKTKFLINDSVSTQLLSFERCVCMPKKLFYTIIFFSKRKRFISHFAVPIPSDYLVQKNLKENAGGKKKKTGHMDTVCWDNTEGLQHIFIYRVYDLIILWLFFGKRLQFFITESKKELYNITIRYIMTWILFFLAAQTIMALPLSFGSKLSPQWHNHTT